MVADIDGCIDKSNSGRKNDPSSSCAILEREENRDECHIDVTAGECVTDHCSEIVCDRYMQIYVFCIVEHGANRLGEEHAGQIGGEAIEVMNAEARSYGRQYEIGKI